jgi:hypothetical protein
MVSKIFYDEITQLECFFNNQDNCHLSISVIGDSLTEVSIVIDEIDELNELIKELRRIKKLMEIHKAL